MNAPALGRGVAHLTWHMVFGLSAAACIGLAAGFLWFATSAWRAADAPAHADGIVVLTGGAERVETGLRLLAAGRADRLLVSGVAHGADFFSLAHFAGVDPAPLAARVTLGHAASTTRGNAAETAAWAQRYALHSLIVVTGFYHMPRALAELSHALPAVTLYRQPVVPAVVRTTHLTSVRLLFGEYIKYLAVRSFLTRLLPPDPGQRPAVKAPLTTAMGAQMRLQMRPGSSALLP